ncbi:MAG: DUF998 domain-containing protein [Kofleriaceae bacterium]
MTQVLLTCGAVGPLLFIAVFLIEGALRPGYRPWRHYVSLLELGDRGWIQRASFVVCGSLTVAFAIGVARALDSVAVPGLFAIFGVALIVSGWFATDPALGYPPGTATTWPPVTSRHGNIHNLAGLFVFVSLPAACFVVAYASHGAWMIYSIVTGIVMPVCFVATGALAERTARGQASDPPVGIAQRLSIVSGWTWLALVALHLALA